MPRRAAFTLVEMAIVVTIVGLIVGAILYGINLQKQASLRTVMTEMENYGKAIEEFRTKYNALPGDMYNATDFWGADASCPATSYNTIPKTATCNGNGDGSIGIYNADASPVTQTQDYELFRAWQQLADAGLIDGSYTGVTGSAALSITRYAVPKMNVPASAVKGIGYTLESYTNALEHPFFTPIPTYSGDWGLTLVMGRMRVNTITDAPAFTPKQAYAIDQKIDDGLPYTGKIRTYRYAYYTGTGYQDVYKGGVANVCVSTDDTAAVYNYSNDAMDSCVLLSVLGQ